MKRAGRTPVAAFRSRMKRQAIIRVEVQVRREDAPLVRSVAEALADPSRAADVRSLLKARFATPSPIGLEALLASAPLDGIELERPRDLGRPVEL